MPKALRLIVQSQCMVGIQELLLSTLNNLLANSILIHIQSDLTAKEVKGH